MLGLLPSDEQADTTIQRRHLYETLLCCMASATDASDEGAHPDVWGDVLVLQYLKDGNLPTGTRAVEAARVKRRASRYRWKDGILRRIMGDGTHRVVPKPDERAELSKQVHEECGHWGEKRSVHLCTLKYWWRGLYSDVIKAVQSCEVCSRINKLSFGSQPDVLHSLVAMGRGYRWGLDIAGPFPESSSGSKYILVMIDHFTKWVELAPLPSKESPHVARAFLSQVIARFGAPAEAVTDQGGEFEGKFTELMEKYLIDHRRTSAYHPQANGLSERTVQSVKASLKKLCEAEENRKDWDLKIYTLQMGYLCSRQASTKLSPAMLMFGEEPQLPSHAREKLEAEGDLDFDNPEAAQASLERRRALMSKYAIMAGGNILIAQHRDRQYWARLKGGGVTPKARRFEPGDYVYHKRMTGQGDSLSLPTRSEVTRVVSVEPGGVLKLVDKHGQVFTTRMEHCAPCNLPDVDGTMDFSVARVGRDLACCVCGSPADEDRMVVCDSCNAAWHTFCLPVPLDKPPRPEEVWCCPRCTANGVRSEQLTDSRGQQHKEETVAEGLHGRFVLAKRKDPYTQESALLYGKVLYRGPKYKPKYLRVEFQDGTVMEAARVGQIMAHLVPGEAQIPATVLAEFNQPTVTAAAPNSLEALPLVDFDYVSWEGTKNALLRLMPGKHTKRHVTNLQLQITRMFEGEQSELPCVETMLEEVERLVECVDLSRFRRGVDMWSGNGTIAAALSDYGITLVNNDLDHNKAAGYHLDALQPSSYKAIGDAVPGALDLVVSSPWFSLLDLALPLAASCTTALACIHVPGHYLSNPILPRTEWFSRRVQEGRLHVVWGRECNKTLKRRCLWVIVAASPEILQLVIKPGYQQMLSVSLT